MHTCPAPLRHGLAMPCMPPQCCPAPQPTAPCMHVLRCRGSGRGASPACSVSAAKGACMMKGSEGPQKPGKCRRAAAVGRLGDVGCIRAPKSHSQASIGFSCSPNPTRR
jgi:hypothetical protein